MQAPTRHVVATFGWNLADDFVVVDAASNADTGGVGTAEGADGGAVLAAHLGERESTGK